MGIADGIPARRQANGVTIEVAAVVELLEIGQVGDGGALGAEIAGSGSGGVAGATDLAHCGQIAGTGSETRESVGGGRGDSLQHIVEVDGEGVAASVGGPLQHRRRVGNCGGLHVLRGDAEVDIIESELPQVEEARYDFDDNVVAHATIVVEVDGVLVVAVLGGEENGVDPHGVAAVGVADTHGVALGVGRGAAAIGGDGGIETGDAVVHQGRDGPFARIHIESVGGTVGNSGMDGPAGDFVVTEVDVIGQRDFTTGGGGCEGGAILQAAVADGGHAELVGGHCMETTDGVAVGAGGVSHRPSRLASGAVFHLPEAFGATCHPL